MRRRKSKKNGMVYFIVFILIAFLVACKLLMGGRGEEQYKKYVSDFSSAVEQYGKNDLENGFGPQSISYNELKNILISKGYFIEFDNQSVTITGDDITISKSDNTLSFYNYNNLSTMENGLRLKFNYNGKDYLCTKNKCNSG